MKFNIKRELNEKKHFDTLADKYDLNYQYSKPFTQYKIDKKSNEFAAIVKSNFKKKNLKILEIGCGTGEYTKRIASSLPKSKIIGLDISNNILEIARKKCREKKNVSFVNKSAYKTDFNKDSFDVVCGFYVFHHLDIEIVKKEIIRILKPGGILFFYEPNILNPIVYLIKSSKALKKMVGDSPDEWAINPLTINKQFSSFEVVDISQTEFIWPIDYIPLDILKFADKATSYFRYLPLIKYLGGSVQICLRKA